MFPTTSKELLEFISRPSERLVADIKKLPGDIMVLGAGGKVGPSLAITARRAFDAAGLKRRVVAVSLFDYPGAAASMREAGVEVIEADISDSAQLASLPDIDNIIYMVGKKFGTEGNQPLTWQVNVTLPAMVAQRFPKANLVSFSTGNVYGMAELHSGGFSEGDMLNPVGEYAQSCMGRERVLEYYSRHNNTPMLMFRLNYAIDMRYGVLYDIAKCVFEGRPVQVRQGVFNCIWQGDVCEYAIRSLLHTQVPPAKLNVSSPEAISIRWAAEEFGKRFGKEPVFEGEEGSRAMFSNCQKMVHLMGAPSVGVITMIDMVANWLKSGGEVIQAPTHFEATDGKF